MYRAGFATAQGAYDKAVREVFAALDRVEGILSTQRYLTGPQLTEADVRLYTTLARFDCVYVGHFKVHTNCFIVPCDLSSLSPVQQEAYCGLPQPVGLPA